MPGIFGKLFGNRPKRQKPTIQDGWPFQGSEEYRFLLYDRTPLPKKIAKGQHINVTTSALNAGLVFGDGDSLDCVCCHNGRPVGFLPGYIGEILKSLALNGQLFEITLKCAGHLPQYGQGFPNLMFHGKDDDVCRKVSRIMKKGTPLDAYSFFKELSNPDCDMDEAEEYLEAVRWAGIKEPFSHERHYEVFTIRENELSEPIAPGNAIKLENLAIVEIPRKGKVSHYRISDGGHDMAVIGSRNSERKFYEPLAGIKFDEAYLAPWTACDGTAYCWKLILIH